MLATTDVLERTNAEIKQDEAPNKQDEIDVENGKRFVKHHLRADQLQILQYIAEKTLSKDVPTNQKADFTSEIVHQMLGEAEREARATTGSLATTEGILKLTAGKLVESRGR